MWVKPSGITIKFTLNGDQPLIFHSIWDFKIIQLFISAFEDFDRQFDDSDDEFELLGWTRSIMIPKRDCHLDLPSYVCLESENIQCSTTQESRLICECRILVYSGTYYIHINNKNWAFQYITWWKKYIYVNDIISNYQCNYKSSWFKTFTQLFMAIFVSTLHCEHTI